jgi:hypothetical protein
MTVEKRLRALLAEIIDETRRNPEFGRGQYGLAEWPSLRTGSHTKAAPRERLTAPSSRSQRGAAKGGKRG